MTSTTHTTPFGRLRLGESSASFDSAFAARIQLYFKVTFLVNVVLAVAVNVMFGSAESRQYYDLVVVNGITFLNGLLWYVSTRHPLKFHTSVLMGATLTLLLSASYTFVSWDSDATDPNAIAVSTLFSIIIVSVVLTLRASLIPSPAVGTALAGVVCMLFPVMLGYPTYEAFPSFMVWTLVAAFLIVGITTFTSHTIYGMERQMFAAKQLGQYQIDRLLGRGGMGEVYLAKHALLQRPTAIKLLRDATGEAARARFRQEVQTASSLTHPNTVEIYDYGRTPEGMFYFAMEYVEGATLQDVVVATGAMSVSRVVHLLAQASSALAEAHDRGLVHRDIKPSNLMLCERGGVPDTLKIMDFGLVRDLSDRPDSNEGLAGTPLYLAPETILSSDGSSAASDIYALGATAYFLIAGRPPFAAANLVEVLSDHLAADIPSLESGNASLDALVAACLQKDPLDRPQDANAFHTMLEECEGFGEWSKTDARIWWSEHTEVLNARKSQLEASMKSAGSASR